MQAFSRLIKTEFRNMRTILLASMAAIIIIQTFLYFYILGKPENLATMLCFTIDGLLISTSAIIPFIHSFTIWSEEWKNNTNYLLFSVPVSKSKIFLSKFSAIFVQYLLLLGISLIGLFIHLSAIMKFNIGKNSLTSSTELLIVLLIISINFIFLCFFSIIVGKLSPKFSGFISFIVFVVMQVLCNGSITLIINTFYNSNTVDRVIIFHNAGIQKTVPTILIYVIFAIIYYLGSVYILEKKVEL